MSKPDAGSVVCPMCWAENNRDTARCFLCGQSLAGATEFAPPKPSSTESPNPYAAPDAGWRPTFQINSMMLLIALVAVFFGVFHESPGLAMVLAFPGTIALVRTLTVASRRPGPPSWFDHVTVFLGTFAAVVTVAVAAGVAFFATCLAIAATGNGLEQSGTGLLVGCIAGVAVLIGLTVVFVRLGRRT